MRLRDDFMIWACIMGCWGSVGQAEAGDALESISYFDDDFLITPPELVWGRDPFLKPPGFLRKETAHSELKLGAVIYDKDNPAAIINGQIVKRGTVLKSGATVTEIGNTYVLVQNGSSLIELSVGVTDGPAQSRSLEKGGRK
jgi:hypothetical protein